MRKSPHASYASFWRFTILERSHTFSSLAPSEWLPGLTDSDGNELVFGELEGTGGFKSTVESQISQRLVEATDWKLRVNGYRSGPIVTCFPNHLPEGIINPLTSSGESEVLGPWANYVDMELAMPIHGPSLPVTPVPLGKPPLYFIYYSP